MLDSHEPARARSRAAAWASGPRPPSQHGSRRITDIVPGDPISYLVSGLWHARRCGRTRRRDARLVSRRRCRPGRRRLPGACPALRSDRPALPNVTLSQSHKCRYSPRTPMPRPPPSTLRSPPPHARGGTTMTWRCTAGASAAATSSSICSSRYGPSPGREARRLRSHESRRLIFQRRGA